MAVDTHSYGDVATIERTIGDLVAGRKFSVVSFPTLAQVEAAIDDAASMMHVAMAEGGYTIDLAATVLADAPRAHQYLAMINNVGGAYVALDYFPGEAQVPQGQDLAQSRSGRYWMRFAAGLKRFQGDGLNALGITKDTTSASKLTVGSYLDSNGLVKVPFFVRGATDFPGTRSLTRPVS